MKTIMDLFNKIKGDNITPDNTSSGHFQGTELDWNKTELQNPGMPMQIIINYGAGNGNHVLTICDVDRDWEYLDILFTDRRIMMKELNRIAYILYETEFNNGNVK